MPSFLKSMRRGRDKLLSTEIAHGSQISMGVGQISITARIRDEKKEEWIESYYIIMNRDEADSFISGIVNSVAWIDAEIPLAEVGRYDGNPSREARKAARIAFLSALLDKAKAED